MNLAALLFDVARRLPDRPAVSDDRIRGTTASWPSALAGIAGGLRARGLAPGDRVLLSLENCGEFFELLFGCWAAGLCAVPANARLHPREVEYIADNSGARLLVATPGLAEALAPLAGTVDTLAGDHLDPHRRIRPAARRRAAALPSRASRPTGPGCSIPPAPPAGRRARC